MRAENEQESGTQAAATVTTDTVVQQPERNQVWAKFGLEKKENALIMVLQAGDTLKLMHQDLNLGWACVENENSLRGSVVNLVYN